MLSAVLPLIIVLPTGSMVRSPDEVVNKGVVIDVEKIVLFEKVQLPLIVSFSEISAKADSNFPPSFSA
ncbi:hypothetical protein HRbin34_00548 [bacterium HR34]|nr:hypothetical protein HRbin34_00548 [bacterium HR34]